MKPIRTKTVRIADVQPATAQRFACMVCEHTEFFAEPQSSAPRHCDNWMLPTSDQPD